MDQKQIKSKIADGYLLTRIILEVVGKPKDYVKESLKDYLSKIKKDKSYIITKETIEPPEENETFFSTFAELEILIKDAPSLLSFCFDYMPSSIEIIEPENLVMKNLQLASFINDLQVRLHTLNTGYIQLTESNKFYIKNAAVLLSNFLIVLLSSRKLTVDEMYPYLGVKKEDIVKVLEILIKEGKIVKEKDKYYAKEK